MKNIYFRTDGNSKIATGHLMRCLAVARACAQKGASAKFIVSDEESLMLLQERFACPQEFSAYCLDSDYKELLPEIPKLLSLVPAGPCNAAASDARPWLFIDSYYASTAYFKALREYFRVAYLDDLRSIDCAVDLLINYDSDEDCACYANASRKLLGAQYTPLREQFHALPYEVRPKVTHILLSTGGTDPYQVAEALLQAIYDNPLSGGLPHNRSTNRMPQAIRSGPYSVRDITVLRSMQYHILTSRSNSRHDALKAFAQAHPSVHIHTNVTEVASLMSSCDLAVSAGGATLCELCAVGVPSVSYLMAENQRTAVETYDKMKLIPCAGDIRPVDPTQDSSCPDSRRANNTPAPLPPTDDISSRVPNPSTLHRILAFLIDMAQDYSARAAVSASMKNFLDGTGAEQIATALSSYETPAIKYPQPSTRTPDSPQ